MRIDSSSFGLPSFSRNTREQGRKAKIFWDHPTHPSHCFHVILIIQTLLGWSYSDMPTLKSYVKARPSYCAGGLTRPNPIPALNDLGSRTRIQQEIWLSNRGGSTVRRRYTQQGGGLVERSTMTVDAIVAIRTFVHQEAIAHAIPLPSGPLSGFSYRTKHGEHPDAFRGLKNCWCSN